MLNNKLVVTHNDCFIKKKMVGKNLFIIIIIKHQFSFLSVTC